MAMKIMDKIDLNKEEIEKKTQDNLSYVEGRIDKLDVLAFETKTLLNIENDVGTETEITSIATNEVEEEDEGPSDHSSDDSFDRARKAKKRTAEGVEFGLDFQYKKVDNPLSHVKRAKIGKSLGDRVKEKLKEEED
jgi:hypothetical protein